jgi:hypothetical protein
MESMAIVGSRRGARQYLSRRDRRAALLQRLVLRPIHTHHAVGRTDAARKSSVEGSPLPDSIDSTYDEV